MSYIEWVLKNLIPTVFLLIIMGTAVVVILFGEWPPRR